MVDECSFDWVFMTWDLVVLGANLFEINHLVILDTSKLKIFSSLREGKSTSRHVSTRKRVNKIGNVIEKKNVIYWTKRISHITKRDLKHNNTL